MNNQKIIELLIVAQKSQTIAARKLFVAECYEQYFTKLFLTSRAMSRDLAEAEDKLQSFFLEKMLSSDCINKFPQTVEGVGAFLSVVFRNYLRSKWRKEKRYLHTHLHFEDQGWNEIQDTVQAEKEVNWSARLKVFSRQLNPTYQKLLELKLEKKSNQEIANLTGRSVNSIKSSFHRIKNKLCELAAAERENQSQWLQRA